MMGTGLRASRMEKACCSTNQALNTKENSRKERDMGLGCISGPILRSTTRENSATDRCMEQARKCGKMGPCTKATGRIMSDMGKGN